MRKLGAGTAALICALGAAQFDYLEAKPLEVRQKYSDSFGSIELVAVCKISESDEPACWGPDGVPNKVLSKQIADMLAKSQGASLTYSLGFKNRMAVFKIDERPGGTLDQISNDRGMGQNVYLASSYQGDRQISYRGVQFKAALDQKEASITSRVRKPMATSGLLKMKLGESMTFMGTQFKVTRMSKTTPNEAVLKGEEPPSWGIGLTIVAKDGVLPQLTWGAVDRDGLTVRTVDSTGTPVFSPPGAPVRNGNFGGGQSGTPKPKLWAATISAFTSYENWDDYEMFSNIDPEKVLAIRARCGVIQRLIIKGIPLDPK